MKAVVAALCVVSFALPAQAGESTDPRDRAVANLGRLNGIALACRAKAESDRFRKAVIAQAPKLREYGDLFEKATDASFREATAKPCPLPEALHGEGDAALVKLEKAFKDSK